MPLWQPYYCSPHVASCLGLALPLVPRRRRCHPPESSSWHSTPALSPDGTVYLGFSRPGTRADIEGTLYALRAPIGNGVEAEVLWAVNLGPGRQTSSPTIGPDGTIYTISGSGWLFAISPEGEVRWTAQVGPALKA